MNTSTWIEDETRQFSPHVKTAMFLPFFETSAIFSRSFSASWSYSK